MVKRSYVRPSIVVSKCNVPHLLVGSVPNATSVNSEGYNNGTDYDLSDEPAPRSSNGAKPNAMGNSFYEGYDYKKDLYRW